MTPCEQKYSTIEKEALAIYKCFTRMRSLILGRNIKIVTDHCPLCHIMTKTVNNTRVDRISTLLQEYDISEVIHINGRRNCLPDYLSRHPRDQHDDLFDIEYGLTSKIGSTISTPSLSNNIIASMVLRPRNNQRAYKPPNSYDQTDNFSEKNSDFNTPSRAEVIHSSTTSTFSNNNFDLNQLKGEQQKDPDIQNYVNQLHLNPINPSFVIKEDILYRLVLPSRFSKTRIQVVCLPSSMVKTLLSACHNDPMSGGHFSVDRTYNKIRRHYWWFNMKRSIHQYIRACHLCQQYNVDRQKRPGQLRSIAPPEGPFQVIGIDYCGPLKITPRSNRYVLIITDYFTRYIVAVPLSNCSAEKTAEALFNNYFCHFGIPELIISDQGSHFRNQLLHNMRLLIGFNHIFSTPYHPQSNGIVERFNSTFIPQISKLQDTETNNWDEYSPSSCFRIQFRSAQNNEIFTL